MSAKVLPLIVAVTLILISSAAVMQHMKFKKLKNQKEEIAAKQKELNEKIDVLTLEKNSAEVRQKQVSTIQQIQQRKVIWSDLFKELSLMISKDIWLSTLQASAKDGKRGVLLEGSGETPQSISLFFQSLELSYFFRRVMLMSSTMDDRTYPPLYRYKFAIPIDEGKDALSMTASAPAKPTPSATPSPAPSSTPSPSPSPTPSSSPSPDAGGSR